MAAEHPLIHHNLSILRNKNTTPPDFRKALYRISVFLAAEATRTLPKESAIVETPMEKTTEMIVNCDVVILPILRAGDFMLPAFLELIPAARVGYIGLKRNEKTLKPEEYYYSNLEYKPDSTVFILDTMIATGGTVCAALAKLQLENVQDITVLSVIAAPEGVEKIMAEFPKVDILTASLDREVDENGYILPGLGDSGDRLCGT